MDRYIVTDENGKVMSFDGGQFCYCDNETWADPPFKCRIYSKQRAAALIERSKAFRAQRRYEPNATYHMVPVILPRQKGTPHA